MARTKQNNSQNENSNKLLITTKDDNKDNNSVIERESDNKTMGSQIINNYYKKTNELKSQMNSQMNSEMSFQMSIDMSNGSKSGNEEKTKVYFIELMANNSIGRQPKAMQNAFSSMKSHKFDPKWIKANEVMTLESFENQLYIIDSFDGQVFDYLFAKKARIIGPLAVLFCYSTDCKSRFDSIPIKPNPIFSQCMRKLIVSVTGFEGQRKLDLINKIERMCGTFSKDFTRRVTHLVSDSVLTKKYKVAKSIGITVLSSEWIDFCWERYQHLTCHASDQQIINKYQLPILKNLMITVSQVDVDERNKIMEIVKNNGGVYSPALKLNVANTLLLLKEPNGEKFKYAVIKRIPCLDVKWIYDSVEKGYALPEDKYQIIPNSQEFNKTQPNHSSYVGNNLKSKVSQQNNIISINHISESLENSNDSSIAITETSTQEIIRSIENLTSDKKDEHFLEGCIIYAVGFDRSVVETIKTAVISCGSVFLNEFKSIATHTIIGPNFNQSNNELLLNNKNCKFVTIEWFYDCLRHEECCNYSKYEFKNRKVINESNNKQNNTPEIFKMPLNVCNESKQALEKWKKASEIHKSESHKSLGDGLNETIHIEWSDKNIDGLPSQRPYIRSTSQHINEVIHEKGQDINEPKISSVASSETEVEIIEENVDNIVNIIESSDSNKTEIIESSASRGFMFSGYDEQTKAQFTNIVEKLKGFVVDSNQVLESVTHLIIRDPSATEKTLSAIASGIWILKEDYLFESKKVGAFVNEDEFEWGFTLSNSSVSELEKKSVRKKLMIAAIDWRKHLQKEIVGKLFDNWSVLIVNETKFTIPYAQVLKCGNAYVQNFSHDLEIKDLDRFKYAFIDEKEINELPKYALKLLKELIKCNKLLKIDFVSHYILNGPKSPMISLTHRLLIRDSMFKDFESNHNRKRLRDESEDFERSNPSKYKK